jgi:MFS superfamily sulfate permease-like transporter
MATSVGDFKLASAAAGFTLGFGLLTVWEAIQQTMANKSPLRSVYIYMVWGEILANLFIGIIAWLFLNGTLGPR